MTGEKEVEKKETLKQVKKGALSAWRLSILTAAILIVISMYSGMAFLVYEGRMSDGPLIFFTGVLLGYILHTIRDMM